MSELSAQHARSMTAEELARREVLVVDRDDRIHAGFRRLLSPEGLHVEATTSPEEAIRLAGERFFPVMIVDLDSPRAGAGAETVRALRSRAPESRILALTARRSWSAAVGALRAGAHDVVSKAPDQADYLKAAVLQALAEGTRHDTQTLMTDVKSVLQTALERLVDAERRAHSFEREAERSRAGTPAPADQELSALVVDGNRANFEALMAATAAGEHHHRLAHAGTGGEALDRVSLERYQLVLVARQLPDLPSTMVIPGVRSQSPDVLVLCYQVGWPLELVERNRKLVLVPRLESIEELAGQLGELALAWRAKDRELRHLEAFRERHVDLVRQVAEVRTRIDRAMTGEETPE